MRAIVRSLAAAVLMLSASVSLAQTPEPQFSPPPVSAVPSPMTPQPPVRQYVRAPINPNQRLIYERAAELARQRDARLETKKWMGISPSRPAVRHGHYSADLNMGLGYPYIAPAPPLFPY